MYLPAFDTIAGNFNTSIDKVQLSLTAFFIGIALGQMIYGPLLDKFGRKKPLIIGLCIYCITTLFCIFVRDINNLIILRFLQALGSCAGMVASRAMIRDYYDSRESARVFSLLMLIVAVSPILAPSAGAFILEYLDWHYIFVSLLLIGLVILTGTLFFLPESFPGDKNLSLSPSSIITKYWSVFVNKTFISYCLVGSIAASGLYAYLAGSSFIFQEIYQLTQKQYSLIFGFAASALILATQLNRLFLKRWTMSQISKIANIGQSCVGIIMLIFALSGANDLRILIGLLFFYLLFQGFIFPNASAMALSPFKASAGTASALLGFLQMGLGALTSGTVSLLHNGTQIPMLTTMCICACGSFAIHFLSTKNKKKNLIN